MVPVRGSGPHPLPAYYLFALIIITGLSIFALDQLPRPDEGSAAKIYLSDRQSVLVPRIASLATQYRLRDRDAAGELQTATSALEQAHDSLIAGLRNGAAGSDVQRELHALYFDGPDALDPALRSLIADARRIAALPPDDPALPALVANLLSESASPVLQRLDAVAAALQHESEGALSNSQKLQWATLAVALSTLAFAIFGFFRPVTTRMMTYTGQLLQLVRFDALTGVANRRSFLQRGAVELARARRYDRPLSLLILEADHFKEITDTYGHDVGNEVLKAMTGVLDQGLRSIDEVGRLRGEEFAALLPETTLADAVNLAERLRQAIANLTVKCGAQTVRVTASMGLVPVPHSLADFETALDAADAARDRAKSSGCNRVVVEDLLAPAA
jgi:diguanylate cyclase (GGDEF)-like protein